MVISVLEAGSVEALLRALTNGGLSVSQLNANLDARQILANLSSTSNALISALSRAIRCTVSVAARIANPREDEFGRTPLLKSEDIAIAKAILDHIYRVVNVPRSRRSLCLRLN